MAQRSEQDLEDDQELNQDMLYLYLEGNQPLPLSRPMGFLTEAGHRDSWRVVLAIVMTMVLAMEGGQASEAAGSRDQGALEIHWRNWSSPLLQEANRSGRRILVDLTASWCHACNVMEAETFQDSLVIHRIREEFIPVRIDVDEFPDLHLRFHQTFRGLPTILILAPDGRTLRQANGMNALDFLDFLEEGVTDDVRNDDASRLFPRAEVNTFPETVAAQFLEDEGKSGTPWGGGVFLETSSLVFLSEMALDKGPLSDQYRQCAFRWLDRLMRPPLLDMAAGGFFRYQPRWEQGDPHFEKLLTVQSRMIMGFLAGAQAAMDPGRRDRYLFMARGTARFVLEELRHPKTPFFVVAQNADVLDRERGTIVLPGSVYYNAPRGASGLKPPIEAGTYLEGNAQLASALLRFAALGDSSLAGEGFRLVEALWEEGRDSSGQYMHSLAGDHGGPATLQDLASLGIALLDAGAVRNQDMYLERAGEVARALKDYQVPGRDAYAQRPGGIVKDYVLVNGNDRTVFFLAVLARETGNDQWREQAFAVFREIVTSAVLVEGDYSEVALGVLIARQSPR